MATMKTKNKTQQKRENFNDQSSKPSLGFLAYKWKQEKEKGERERGLNEQQKREEEEEEEVKCRKGKIK